MKDRVIIDEEELYKKWAEEKEELEEEVKFFKTRWHEACDVCVKFKTDLMQKIEKMWHTAGASKSELMFRERILNLIKEEVSEDA